MESIFDDEQRCALDRWLGEKVPQLGEGALHTSLITGGSSNIVVRLDRGNAAVVLRKAPAQAPPASARAIEREATVLRALGGSDVPHPQFHGFSGDAAIVGGPFYVMDLVDGWAATITPQNTTIFDDRFAAGPDQHYLGYAMVDGMIAMANLDYKSAGLGEYGKPQRYLDRQVERWMGQLASYPERYPGFHTRDLPGLDHVADWLARNVPDTGQPGLMHGDYALNNVLFENRPPSRLAAIIDWETSTIGDPLMDLAGFAQNLRRSGREMRQSSYFDNANFPRFEDVTAYYSERTGRDVANLDYYIVLFKFRMACILEYKVAEAMVGLANKDKGRRFDALVRQLLTEAEELTRAIG